MQTSVIKIWRLALVLAGLPLLATNVQGIGSDATVEKASGVVQTSDQPAPPNTQLSQGATEIVKLAQSGVGEDVMLAYIGNVNSKFNLGSDQIIYLNDIGVSSDVVKAMIQRDTALEAASQAAVANLVTPSVPPPPMPPDTASNPSTPPMEPPTAANPPDNSGENPTADDADYFYNSLAPYGAWIYVPGCGLCWQPTVCLVNREWRPYSDRGRWIYTDCGWYWQSDYSWGWAAFHYGRWFNNPDCGWVWAPGSVWGPAWVSWRLNADYCGWAPLPPSAQFTPGSGFLYQGHVMGPGFEFGLQPSQYTFIPLARLTDYAPARYSLPASQANEVFAQTSVINHFTIQNNHVVNPGIDPRAVAALAGTEVRSAEIREMPSNGSQPVQPDRLTKRGVSLVIFRPQLPAPTSQRMTRATSQGISRPISAPARSIGSPRASIDVPGYRPEVYPPGSLIIIGSRTRNTTQTASSAPLPNMNLSYLANQRGSASQPASAQPEYPPVTQAAYAPQPPSAGFNFGVSYSQPNIPPRPTPQYAPIQSQTTFVMPGRFSVAQHLSANMQPASAASYTVASRVRVDSGSDSPERESHSESRPPSESESHAEPHAAHSESAPVSHASSVSSSSSSGHR